MIKLEGVTVRNLDRMNKDMKDLPWFSEIVADESPDVVGVYVNPKCRIHIYYPHLMITLKEHHTTISIDEIVSMEVI